MFLFNFAGERKEAGKIASFDRKKLYYSGLMNRLDRSPTSREIIDPRSGSKDLGRRCASRYGGHPKFRRGIRDCIFTVVSRQKGTETDGRCENERIMSPAPRDCTKFRVKADKG